MRTQPRNHFVFSAFVEFLLDFFQSKMDDIMVMHFERSDAVAETKPKSMNQVDFVGGEIRSVRTEDFVDLVTIGEMDFKIELGLGVRKSLPSIAEMPSLLFGGFFGGMAEDDSARLERSSSTQNAVPQLVCGDDGKANGFATLFGHGKSL